MANKEFKEAKRSGSRSDFSKTEDWEKKSDSFSFSSESSDAGPFSRRHTMKKLLFSKVKNKIKRSKSITIKDTKNGKLTREKLRRRQTKDFIMQVKKKEVQRQIDKSRYETAMEKSRIRMEMNEKASRLEVFDQLRHNIINSVSMR